MTIDAAMDERLGLPSASGAPRWVPCTASFKLEQMMPDEDRACQRRGTKIHKALETSNLSNLNHSDTICAERIMYHEGRLVDKYGLEGSEIIREKRFWIKQPGGGLALSARIDTIHFTKKLALVINYKTGFYEQEKIDKDWQCATEAACVWSNLHPERIVVAKIHPNDHPGFQAKECIESLLAKTTVRLQAASAEAVGDDAQFNPGERQCQWCMGKKLGTCLAYREWRSKNEGSH